MSSATGHNEWRDMSTLDFFSRHRSQALQTLFRPLPSLSIGLAASVAIDQVLIREGDEADSCSVATDERAVCRAERCAGRDAQEVFFSQRGGGLFTAISCPASGVSGATLDDACRPKSEGKARDIKKTIKPIY